jgi:hypothetical protein
VSIFKADGLGMSLPVYTTRRDGTGESATYSCSLWMTLLAGFIVWLNIIVWGLIGLAAAVVVVEAIT